MSRLLDGDALDGVRDLLERVGGGLQPLDDLPPRCRRAPVLKVAVAPSGRHFLSAAACCCGPAWASVPAYPLTVAASTYSTCERCGRGILVRDGVLALHARRKVKAGETARKCPGSGQPPTQPLHTARS